MPCTWWRANRDRFPDGARGQKARVAYLGHRDVPWSDPGPARQRLSIGFDWQNAGEQDHRFLRPWRCDSHGMSYRADRRLERRQRRRDRVRRPRQTGLSAGRRGLIDALSGQLACLDQETCGTDWHQYCLAHDLNSHNGKNVAQWEHWQSMFWRTRKRLGSL